MLRSGPDRLGTSQEFWSWENVLVATKDWGPWTANGEIGYSLPFGEKKGSARGVFFANTAVGFQILDWLQPEVELNYFKEFVAEGDPGQALALTAGLVLPVHDRLRIMIGVQRGVWGRNIEQPTTLQMAVKTSF